jgi:hypothetical protein
MSFSRGFGGSRHFALSPAPGHPRSHGRQALQEQGGSQQTERRSNVPSGEIEAPAMCSV